MRVAFVKIVFFGCLLATAGLAQQALSVDKLVEFVTSSVKQKMQDKDVAHFLAGVRMSERLAPRTVEDLQGKGAGAKTVAALNRLAELSATLPVPVAKLPPPPPKLIPAPAYDEQYKILGEVRSYALNYSKSLPDFLCLQVTRRYMDRHFVKGQEGSWSPVDRVAAKLTYFGQEEKYELLSSNDNSLFGKNYESVGGAISTGEFGSVLRQIFEPESSAEFHWERWGTLRGHLSHVYSYRIDRAHSKETIDYNRQQQVTPGYHGLIFAQKGSNVILRVTVEPDIPESFPIQEVRETIDYNYADISGQQFILPVSAEVIMRSDRVANRNEIEFRAYRKYSADTSIKFEDTEEPASPDSPPAASGNPKEEPKQ